MTQQINLFNPIFLRQKKYFSLVTIMQALALVLVGAMSFYAYAVFQTGRLSKEVEETNKRMELEKERLGQAKVEFGPKKKSTDLEKQVTELEKKVRDREEILGVQKDGVVPAGKGFSEYMRAFARQSVNGLWLTNFRMRGNGGDMVIIGRALRPDLVPDYLKRLGNERIMNGQPFSTLEMQLTKIEKNPKGKGGEGYFEFSLRSQDAEKVEADVGMVR